MNIFVPLIIPIWDNKADSINIETTGISSRNPWCYFIIELARGIRWNSHLGVGLYRIGTCTNFNSIIGGAKARPSRTHSASSNPYIGSIVSDSYTY